MKTNTKRTELVYKVKNIIIQLYSSINKFENVNLNQPTPESGTGLLCGSSILPYAFNISNRYDKHG
jgi:hypothetical protein